MGCQVGQSGPDPQSQKLQFLSLHPDCSRLCDEVQTQHDLRDSLASQDEPLQAAHRSAANLDPAARSDVGGQAHLAFGLQGDPDILQLGGKLGLVARFQQARHMTARPHLLGLIGKHLHKRIPREQGLEKHHLLPRVVPHAGVQRQKLVEAVISAEFGHPLFGAGTRMGNIPTQTGRWGFHGANRTAAYRRHAAARCKGKRPSKPRFRLSESPRPGPMRKESTSTMAALSRPVSCLAAGLLAVGLPALSLSAAERPGLTLQGNGARLEIDLAGGAIAGFIRSGDTTGAGLNPLDWGTPKPTDTAPHAHGHFLCLDRWGPPSKAEGANGMPYHGEASSVLWHADAPPAEASGALTAVLSARLPLAGLAVRRTVRLAPQSAFAVVREEVTNEGKLGRVYNIVQHPTIAPPFLDAATVVDCNGVRGFAQEGSMPNPEEPTTHWPDAVDRDGTRADLRHLTTDPRPAVTSFAIDADIGWVTAASPARRLLIGYLWRTRDYPWVSLWRAVQGGHPSARGLEFGSTGLHQPFPILTRKGRIFDRPLFDYLDAKESATRSYAMFLADLPPEFRGVDRIERQGADWILVERGPGTPRRVPLVTGGLSLN